MTTSARLAPGAPFVTELLAIGLVILTIPPLVIFATDLPNRGVMRAARHRAQQASGDRLVDEDREARRQRIREDRSTIHVTVPRVGCAIVFQLVTLTVIAVVGRRVFALRL
ncbi:MAG: hypothetical protein M3Z05_20710 [Gemmatimonadota bacterium]|nr:hypothetical protein [Gemmatimonadota bacterium]